MSGGGVHGAEGRPEHSVRLRHVDAKGFAHFDFAIGDQTLYVELVLPYRGYEQFCELQAMKHLTKEQGACMDRDASKWKFCGLEIQE